MVIDTSENTLEALHTPFVRRSFILAVDVDESQD